MVILCTVLHSGQFKDQKSLISIKNLHSAVTVRQASDTHIEKPRHFKTAIAAEPEVVSIIRKHIWNHHFKFYILSFVGTYCHQNTLKQIVGV